MRRNSMALADTGGRPEAWPPRLTVPTELRRDLELLTPVLQERYPLDALDDPAVQRRALAFAVRSAGFLGQFLARLTGLVARQGAVVVTGAHVDCDEHIAVLSSVFGVV